MRPETPITTVDVRCYTVPTRSFGAEMPESDGTAEWDSTSMVIVQLSAGGVTGLGYAYASTAAFDVVRDVLTPLVLGADALDVSRIFWSAASAVRNLGWAGVCAGAISAVDAAVHDLRCRLLDVSLSSLLGGAHHSVPAYGSGGFTNYSNAQLREQLAGWAQAGFQAVKLKIGRDPDADIERVTIAREAIGPEIELFVDANGAYEEKQALWFAERFADLNVTWFEEPVSSDNRVALSRLRARMPEGMRVAAGEYAYTPTDFFDLISASAVDVLQADATRCGGPSGFLLAAAQAQAAGIPLSAHTAPALHGVVGSACANVINVEYFHDHALIESQFFDGVPALNEGMLVPDPDRPGNGLEFDAGAAQPYLTAQWRNS
jgi:L-alanine-DL-glutamate epimerase-like enolase superfamily enzyme